MNEILKDLKIDETFTKQRLRKPRRKGGINVEYNHVKNSIPLKEDYNFMCDVLHLPEDKNGFKYLFVIVDLATDEFDIECMKTLDQESALAALKNCNRRKYIHVDKKSFTVTSDGGQEFSGIFHKWLWDQNIFHRTGIGYRHNQHANVESLNKQLSRLFNGYMNMKEEETGKVYKNWTDILSKVRIQLNKYRKKKLPKDPDYPTYDITTEKTATIEEKVKGKSVKKEVTYLDIPKPKYKVGDVVHRLLEVPKNALGKNQNTTNFRSGDYNLEKEPRTIKQVLFFPDVPHYRYLLEGIKKASYSETELKKI